MIENYSSPYSTQQYVAVLLWNTLNPEFAMELPTDCDLVPIKDLTGPEEPTPKGKVRWANEEIVYDFRDRYPEVYDRLEKSIYKNRNINIRHMKLTTIAKPKNSEIQLPEWFSYLIDPEKVTMDALNLISPILKSLGLNALKTDASTEYMTNIIDL